MISNDVYKDLKMLKGKNSFSEILKDLIKLKDVNLGAGLKDCLGLLEKDNELKEVEKTIKKGWNSWSKRYA